MSLFGEVETPRAERPGPAVKALTELSLRVYGARLEPEQNVVRLHAEAKTAFDDDTTGAGIAVGFFLNGHRLADVPTDDYGLALLDVNLKADGFRDGDNELVVRVKGFARDVKEVFAVLTECGITVAEVKSLTVQILQAELDLTGRSLHLRAIARVTLKDDTTKPRVPVALFWNGKPLASAHTDQFGVASMETEIASRDISIETSNNVEVRIPGMAVVGSITASTTRRQIRLRNVRHHWNAEIDVPVFRPYYGPSVTRIATNDSETTAFGYFRNEFVRVYLPPDNLREIRRTVVSRFEGTLTIDVFAECEGATFPLKGVEIAVIKSESEFHEETLASGVLDEAGKVRLTLDGYFSDERTWLALCPREFVLGRASTEVLEKLRFIPKDDALLNLSMTKNLARMPLKINVVESPDTFVTHSVTGQGNLKPEVR